MQFELPLAQMSIADKLHVMEALWADLAGKADHLPSPDWHREVLQERKRLVESGQLEFQDWDAAIAELRGEYLNGSNRQASDRPPRRSRSRG